MSKKLLVVDDVPEIRQLLCAAFAASGWQVQTAPDAATAREMKRAARFDLVLSDVDMPGESGCELVRWIVRNYPATPTILMSGRAAPCEECPLIPHCPIVQKPFKLTQLIETVNKTAAKVS